MIFDQPDAEKSMRRKRSNIVFCLFFAPFLAVGLALCAYAAYLVTQHLASQSWQATPAVLLGQGEAKELTSSGTEAMGGTSRIAGRYSYVWQGQTYQSDRLIFSQMKTREWGVDTDGWDAKLEAMLPALGGAFTVWVDPRRPQQAVMLRDIRWLELGAMVAIGLLLVVSSSVMLWGAGPHAAPAGFSWKSVALTAAIGIPLAGLALLLWRDGHPVWAAVATLPLLLALIGLCNGLFRLTTP
jgi:hypothetical protein